MHRPTRPACVSFRGNAARQHPSRGGSRDASYLDKHEPNGRKVFWSRGNGWVMASLAHVLTRMPTDYLSRPRYIGQFRQMSASLAKTQGKDGLWRSGLLDPAA